MQQLSLVTTASSAVVHDQIIRMAEDGGRLRCSRQKSSQIWAKAREEGSLAGANLSLISSVHMDAKDQVFHEE